MDFAAKANALEAKDVRITALYTTNAALVGQHLTLKFSKPVFELKDFDAIRANENIVGLD